MPTELQATRFPSYAGNGANATFSSSLMLAFAHTSPVRIAAMPLLKALMEFA